MEIKMEILENQATEARGEGTRTEKEKYALSLTSYWARESAATAPRATHLGNTSRKYK
jgi:hypothetical protein